LGVIDAEIERIGLVRVQYERQTDSATGAVTATEKRISFSVSEGSSLEKLLQAYIAAGGNPFDISHFFYQDETEIVDSKQGLPVKDQNYPYDGVVAPQTAKYNQPEGTFHPYPGGFIPLKKYLPNRLGGGRQNANEDDDNMVDIVHSARNFCNQDIRERIQELEHRIIKLCDLREQLISERDEVLVQAFGGTLYELPEFDTDRFADDIRVQRIVHQMDTLLFETDSTGLVKSLSTDKEKIAQYATFYEDSGEEIFLLLMA
jgi:hypothetical protein